ncbi:MAG TPA: histidine kinase N-terminal 7TM domain-containing protein [Caldilineaceae bacterium]|nr:histidine kinase N-terminal 7TM domain-containing protein [Caldilineaceae bacterium]
MHPLAPFLAVPLLIGAAITFALGIYAWGRRGEPGVTAFLFTSVGLAAWSIFYSLEIMSAEFETKLFWHKMVYTMLVLVPGPWALFLYQYDTRTKRLPPWLPWALAVEPVLFVLLTWTNGALHTLVWRSVTLTGDVPDLEFVRGPFFWVHTLYSYLLILIATYFFTRMLWHEPKLPRWQVAVLALAAFFPLIINFIHVMQLHPFYPLDLTPFALATMGTAASWYAFRFEIWDFLPAAHNVIVESMNDGMIVLDVEQTVVEINPAALELLGMQRSDAIGRPVAAILPSWETVYTHHKEAMTPWELVLPSEPDKRYVDLVYSNLYSRNHRLTGALLTLRNVTARKLAEQALAEERTLLAHRVNEQTADLRKANGELARVAKMKDEFLANMSHELRTPLNTILGLSEALQEQVYGPLGERQVRALRNVEESGRHLLTLINDILDVSKIEAGKLSLELQAVSADSVCQASLGLVRQMAHKKQIEVLYTPDPMVAVLQADERRLKQILVNLLSNAVKFTPEGGKIGLEVKGDRTQEAINFTVWDTGVGIASEDLQRLFQPFVQLDSRLSRYHDGSGLGLVLVYRMTQLHGGSVGVSSAVGAGSRFTVSLPWREPMMPAFMQSAAETEALLTQMRRVLLVDNSPTTIDQVRRYLLELGAETIVLPDSVDPVETARREQPDLIIMDVVFSDQPSTQILSDLRRCPETSVIPVLVLSVVADSVLSNMPIDDGQQRVYHLLKPISRQQLSQGLVRAMLQPPQTVDQPPAPTLLEGANDGCQPVILIVEDNETNIRTLVDYLGAKHYRLEVARSGTEAIALLRQIQADLVLMDIQMPNMDGIEVIRLIRSELGLASLPIIAVTALAMPGDREKTLAAGANDYLSKPVSLKRLVALVEQYICRGEHEQQ